jgi:hypothetical protein
VFSLSFGAVLHTGLLSLLLSLRALVRGSKVIRNISFQNNNEKNDKTLVFYKGVGF